MPCWPSSMTPPGCTDEGGRSGRCARAHRHCQPWRLRDHLSWFPRRRARLRVRPPRILGHIRCEPSERRVGGDRDELPLIPLGAPAARCYALMTDAPGETGVLLFGGWDTPEAPGSTWQATWGFKPDSAGRRSSRSTSPSTGDVFGFDTQSERAVFVEVSGATWAFDVSTGTWERRSPEIAPPAHGSRMAYDSESDRLISFGGDNFGPLFDDTWAFDLEADTWTRMDPPTSPSARSYYSMAYDERSDRVVLFGGGSVGDTWTYDFDSDTWKQLSDGGGPEPRAYASMVYDSSTERLILFGGVSGPAEEPLDDTWTFDLETAAWTQIEVPGPSARGWHVMAADRETSNVVLFGGGASRSDCSAETWIFDPGANTWSQAGSGA